MWMRYVRCAWYMVQTVSALFFVTTTHNRGVNRWQLKVPENTGSAARAPWAWAGLSYASSVQLQLQLFNFNSKMRKMLNTSRVCLSQLSALSSQLPALTSSRDYPRNLCAQALVLSKLIRVYAYTTMRNFTTLTSLCTIHSSSTIAAASCTSCSFSRR